MIKCYCCGTENHMSKAFELLEQLKTKSLKPDEVIYNTLLDGCARFWQWERGLAVVREMQEVGVPPSNFTLSVLVKLANRCRRPREAFSLTEGLATKYNIRLNIHVYNNLINACTLCADMPESFKLLERLLNERVRPD